MKEKNLLKLGDLNSLNGNVSDLINELIKKTTPTYENITLEATKWSGNKYSLEEQYPSNIYDIELRLVANATEEMKSAWKDAETLPDETNKNIIVATGIVPTININFRIKLVKK